MPQHGTTQNHSRATDCICMEPFYQYRSTPWIFYSILSNSLIYDKGYSKRQCMIYSLILLMKDEWLGYRRISKKLNKWEVKTHRGCEWFNKPVISFLKRKYERDDLVNNIRNKHYPSKVSRTELKYYTFDYFFLTNSNTHSNITKNIIFCKK